jgi:hypothetical protein
MSFLDRISSSLSNAVRSAESFVENAVDPSPPPAPPPSAPPPSVFTDGMDRGGGLALNLTGTGNATNPEGAVASRADRNVPMRLEGTSQAERLTNLARLTQVDGDYGTRTDGSTCGVQCVVSGLYLQNPTGLEKVAQMELTKNADKLDGWARQIGVSPAQLKKDLQATANGNPSPRQLSMLSEVLYKDVQARRGLNGGGLNSQDLQVLTKDILVKDSGVPAPEMRLELRQTAGGGHWNAEFDVATMQDIEENAKKDCVVSFDPWPNQLGGAQTGVAINKQGAASLHQGSNLEEHSVAADGTIY